MNGRHSATGSLWTSTAALNVALAVLFSAFAGLAAFLLGRMDVEWVAPPGNPPVRSPVNVDDALRWGPTEFRLDQMTSVNLDGDALARDVEGADVFAWGGAELSNSHGVYVWQGRQRPTATDCATYLSTHATREYLRIGEGMTLCVRTSESRVALLTIKKREGDAWLAEAQVWKQQLPN
ncbi:hypothetical protein [Allorhizocola rhizosphaerae]|uniref:hypothetical protein n=1 Tax=Allorhizocola rhizosphaerae TaxID=1872709 RepID=UPI000E3BBE84|nr:hypothetical protein [Allorhizocola rhizosphaerae]